MKPISMGFIHLFIHSFKTLGKKRREKEEEDDSSQDQPQIIIYTIQGSVFTS
jgi:hypothetical protein